MAGKLVWHALTSQRASQLHVHDCTISSTSTKRLMSSSLVRCRYFTATSCTPPLSALYTCKHLVVRQTGVNLTARLPSHDDTVQYLQYDSC